MNLKRYYRNVRNRHARHLTKRFVEQAPYSTTDERTHFEKLARLMYAARDTKDIEGALTLIADFCKEVEARGQEGNEAAGQGTSGPLSELVSGQPS